MRRFLGVVSVAVLALGPCLPARAADETNVRAIIDKGIKALGGEENLVRAQTATWKTKGKFILEGTENPFTTHTTVQGLDHYRQEFEGEYNNMPVKFVRVLDGDKGCEEKGPA
jgi:hypothetical protein